MVNNHGDRCCPLRIGVGVVPLPFMAMKMAEIDGGDPNYLQVLG